MTKISYLQEDNENEEGSKMNDSEKKSPRRILVKNDVKTNLHADQFSNDILIVASKLKKYVKEKHGMNTSGNVMEMLSNIVRIQCDRAVEKAKLDGRKTLMDRDF
ncbi:hypothetical protein HBN50_10740 [Halobacteriovorax sp. GB3]|uniref:hypothetical protein n=1 Tax=Halobacteriovorax sp. GB3 TaxID=2719615 RepID=UPI002360BDF2|nr:hypothetical protein [Halobacteriovorax sp. GB3]MDD0853579.1 hypothetical protein [Halobacteriovorax sp. GB3]